MPKFRKKPVVIEAIQWRIVNHEQIKSFLGDAYQANLNQHSGKDNYIRIGTLEGVMDAAPGDWIIRGVQGEFYPCKPDIFEATYEQVSA